MIELIVLAGNSGSGKSTYARTLGLPETAIVSSDHCRAMITDNESDMTVNVESFSLLHAIVVRRLASRHSTIVDSTALQPFAREPFRAYDEVPDCTRKLVYLRASVEHCIAAQSFRERKVPEYAIRRMGEQATKLDALIESGDIYREGWESVEVVDVSWISEQAAA